MTKYEYATTYGGSGVRITKAGKRLRNRNPSDPEPPKDDDSEHPWELVGTSVEGNAIYWTWRRLKE